MKKARDGSNMIVWLLHWPRRAVEFYFGVALVRLGLCHPDTIVIDDNATACLGVATVEMQLALEKHGWREHMPLPDDWREILKAEGVDPVTAVRRTRNT